MSDDGDDFDLGKSVAAKHDGMDRAEANAMPGWGAAMLECVITVARELGEFTADDVFRVAKDIGIYDGTHDRRAFGPVMHRAVKHGYCVKADCAGRNSCRRSTHNSPLTVWKSLILEGPANVVHAEATPSLRSGGAQSSHCEV